jgi:hypothetical protein
MIMIGIAAMALAIGGNVVDRFMLTLDYPHATAWFRCAHDCVRAVP